MENPSKSGATQSIRKATTGLSKRKPFLLPVWVFRSVSILLITGGIVAGASCRTGYGRICAFEKGIFGFICPLGYLEIALANRSLLPQLWIPAAAGILLILLFGRFFCAWVCPASLIRTLKSKVHLGFLDAPLARIKSLTRKVHLPAKSKRERPPGEGAGGGTATNLAVLVGVLASSYLFGFPVFCLICPVGLTFGTIFALIRWVSGSPPGLELLFFPTVILVELFVLKSWCRSLCPLGALYGLVSRLNFFLRPKADQGACLLSQGVHCQACKKACPQGISPVKMEQGGAAGSCTKCLECYEKCPAGAIHIQLFKSQ